ncbi:MAG: hypothetical protein ACREIF_19495 [Chthoniobacterales bacterium]
MKMIPINEQCQPPEGFPADYCQKLKHGIERLRTAIQSHYEEAFPNGRDWIARAVQEAEQSAWSTPFPSLFFPALAHLKVREMIPAA